MKCQRNLVTQVECKRNALYPRVTSAGVTLRLCGICDNKIGATVGLDLNAHNQAQEVARLKEVAAHLFATYELLRESYGNRGLQGKVAQLIGDVADGIKRANEDLADMTVTV